MNYQNNAIILVIVSYFLWVAYDRAQLKIKHLEQINKDLEEMNNALHEEIRKIK